MIRFSLTMVLGICAVTVLFGATRLIAQPQSVKFVGGSAFIYIVKGDGTVSGFGSEDSDGAMRSGGRGMATPQPLMFPAKVRQIVSGYDMHFALLEDGRVLAWGMNDRGQFGRGPGSSRTPENPIRSSTPVVVPLPKDLVEIVANGHYGLALRSNGVVLAWGSHAARDGDFKSEVVSLTGLPPAAAVAAGGEHFLVLAKTGEVYGYGDNRHGQLGATPADPFRSSKAVKVAGLTNVVSIACAGTTNFGFSGAVKSDGTVWMWGSNQSATMGKPLFWGNGGPDGSVNSVPEKVAGITTARSIAAGPGHIVVRLADGTLRLWGHDGWGQIGIGTSGGYHPSPKKPAITGVTELFVAGNRTFAVKSDGTLWWWGVSISRVGGPFGRDTKSPTQITGF